MATKAPANDNEDEIIGAREVAKLLGIGLHTCYEATNRGEIPHVRVGKRILYSKARILEWAGGRG